MESDQVGDNVSVPDAVQLGLPEVVNVRDRVTEFDDDSDCDVDHDDEGEVVYERLTVPVDERE